MQDNLKIELVDMIKKEVEDHYNKLFNLFSEIIFKMFDSYNRQWKEVTEEHKKLILHYRETIRESMINIKELNQIILDLKQRINKYIDNKEVNTNNTKIIKKNVIN